MIDPQFLEVVSGPIMGHVPRYIELRAFDPSGKTPPHRTWVRTYERAAEWAQHEDNVEGRDVYYGVLRRKEATTGSAENCVEGTHVLWADFDAKTFRGGMMGPRSAYAEITAMRMSPHIVVDSGHGYHAYWLLDKEYDFIIAQQVMQGIERVHGSDHCSDQPRILRVPGTHNYKDAQRLPVRIVRWDMMTPPYSLLAFTEYAMSEYREPKPPSVYAGTEGWERSSEGAPKFGVGTRNNGLARLAGIMVARGMKPDDILVALGWENEHRCDPPLLAHEVAAIAKSVQRYRK